MFTKNNIYRNKSYILLDYDQDAYKKIFIEYAKQNTTSSLILFGLDLETSMHIAEAKESLGYEVVIMKRKTYKEETLRALSLILSGKKCVIAYVDPDVEELTVQAIDIRNNIFSNILETTKSASEATGKVNPNHMDILINGHKKPYMPSLLSFLRNYKGLNMNLKVIEVGFNDFVKKYSNIWQELLITFDASYIVNPTDELKIKGYLDDYVTKVKNNDRESVVSGARVKRKEESPGESKEYEHLQGGSYSKVTKKKGRIKIVTIKGSKIRLKM